MPESQIDCPNQATTETQSVQLLSTKDHPAGVEINKNLIKVHIEELCEGKSIATITFNDDVQRNAMTEEMAATFKSTIEILKEEKPTVIIVTGAGSAFSAGGDMEMIRRKQTQTAEQNSEEMFNFYMSFLSILDLNVPVIAAVNGAAIGAGLSFVCACDKRLVAEGEIANLGFSFVKLGLTPGMGGTIFTKQRIGQAKANEMLEEGYNITPLEAYNLGFFDKIVKASELTAESRKLAMEIASSPEYIVKILSDRIGKQTFEIALRQEAKNQGASFLTSEHRKKYVAFLEWLTLRKSK